MSTLERLKKLEDEYPADGLRVPVCALTEAWEFLPKLLALIEAGKMLEFRAISAAEYLKASGHLSEAARLENALKVYATATAEL